jgi:hypothetical protein
MHVRLLLIYYTCRSPHIQVEAKRMLISEAQASKFGQSRPPSPCRSRPSGAFKRGTMKYVCSHCAVDCETPSQCSRCKSVVYCGSACQRAHWKAGMSVCAESVCREREQCLSRHIRCGKRKSFVWSRTQSGMRGPSRAGSRWRGGGRRRARRLQTP